MFKKDMEKYPPSRAVSNIVKWWLTIMLLFIPFQTEIMNHIAASNVKLLTIIRLLEEITIFIFFPLSIIEFYREKIQYQLFILIFFPLFVFSISSLISGVVNGNSLFVTSYGIFYYIKYFFLIVIYAAFFKSYDDFKKIFQYMLIIAVIVGFVAFIQEVWMLLFRYVFEQGTATEGINMINSLILKVTRDNVVSWRLGIYRVSSFMSHYNLLGFYSLVILAVYLYTVKRLNPFFFLSLLSGIYFSISRTAFIGFAILGIMQIVKGRKWLIFFIIIPICVLLYSISPMSTIELEKEQKMKGAITYRQYARYKAMEIWKDYPFFGIGPGMFGGPIALKTNSPVYEEYNFSLSRFSHYKDLDQFWPQALAETGIVGTAVFAGLYLSLLLAFFISRKKTISNDLKEFLAGLGIVTIFMIINTFAYSLVIASILYPYCALAGMGLGSASRFKQGT